MTDEELKDMAKNKKIELATSERIKTRRKYTWDMAYENCESSIASYKSITRYAQEIGSNICYKITKKLYRELETLLK